MPTLDFPSSVPSTVKFEKSALTSAICRISNWNSDIKQNKSRKASTDERNIYDESKRRKLSREDTIQLFEQFDQENEALMHELIAMLPELFYVRDWERNPIWNVKNFVPSIDDWQHVKTLLEQKIIKADEIQTKYKFYLRNTPQVLKAIWKELTGFSAPVNFKKWVDAGQWDIIKALQDPNLMEVFN